MKIVLKLHQCALYFLIRPKKQPIQQVSRRRPNCIEYPSIHIQHVQPGDLLDNFDQRALDSRQHSQFGAFYNL